MKAITIHQPWAQLIALGIKKIETRSWRTHYQGPIAIHASQRLDFLDVFIATVSSQRTVVKKLKEAGFDSLCDLPFGCVIGVGYLDRVDPAHEIDLAPKELERQLGLFCEGRFAWRFSQTRLLETPIPACGHQGLWNLPEELEI